MRDDTLDQDDENAVLMPIGGPNVTVDVAPEPIRLDPVNVDKAIAELIQNDHNDKQTGTDQSDKSKRSTADADRDDTTDDRPTSAGNDSKATARGRLRTKHMR